MKAVVFLLLLGIALVAAQGFTAKVLISNSPGVAGSLTGSFSYSHGAHAMRINLDIGPVEFYDYTNRLRFLQCGTSCDTETWTEAEPILYPEAGDTVTGVVIGNGCAEHRKAGGAPSIYVNGAGQVCRAVFSDGSVYDFSAWGAEEAPTAFVPTATCPKPLCTKRIDFELIFDESGSIEATAFKQEKAFATDFAKAFTWGYDYVGMGLSMFSTNARLPIPFTFSQGNFIQGVSLVTQRQGNTCIGCGIQSAVADITQNGRMIPGTNTPVTRVFVILTDGENNVGDYIPPLNAAKNQGIIFFAIGVGSQVSHTQIEEIGSDLAGVQTTFYGTDFSALPGILNGLVTATCVNIPGNPCGSGCLGFCGCGSTCMCPNVCDDGNACTDDSCQPGVNGNGCIHTPHNCDDGNACTMDSCDPAGGCQHSPVNCDDNNVCTTDTCDPRIGCNNANIVCKDLSPCTTDSCVAPTQGCTFTPIQNCPQVCSDPTKPINCPYINCSRNECDPQQNGKCVATPRVCNDNNPCTIDTCDSSKDGCVYTPKNCDDNNKCTTDYCDTNGICQNMPINVTAVCNDYNACTVDTCEPLAGCVHKNRTCSDGNVCTNDMCNTVTGCYYPPVDCWKQDDNLKNRPDLIGCFQAVCQPANNTACQLIPIPNSTIDQCNVCNGDGSTCLGQLTSGTAVGLGAGAVAGIVIGVVGVAAVLGVLGGKKGYDVWLKHRANMQGANTSPLYTHNGLSGNNPMYNPDQGA